MGNLQGGGKGFLFWSVGMDSSASEEAKSIQLCRAWGMWNMNGLSFEREGRKEGTKAWALIFGS